MPLPTYEKINVNSIVEQLIDAYGSSFLMSISGFIFFIFILFLAYRFLKSKGWFKTPLEISLENVQHGINQMNTFFIETMQDHEAKTNKILANQDYKLSDEQVDIIIKDKEYIYTQELIDICVGIHVKNHIRDNPPKTISKIESSFKAKIIREDKEFAKLPDVNKHIISTNRKLEVLKSHDIYTRLYEIMVEYNGKPGTTEDYIRNTKLLLENHISTHWFTKD